MGFILVRINLLFLETMVSSMVIFAILAATFLGIPTPLVGAQEGECCHNSSPRHEDLGIMEEQI